MGACLSSVRAWAAQSAFAYRWLDDELFSLLPKDLQPAERVTPVIASDLARLLWARSVLLKGEAQQVLWLDSDVLIFRPDEFELPDVNYAVGREIWVERNESGAFRARTKVHNAALFFRADSQGRNSFLDFYVDTAFRLLRAHTAGMPPQFIGPKLLTALYNVVQLPVLECVGMVSPCLAADLLGDGREAIDCYLRKKPHRLVAANLCRSAVNSGEMTAQAMKSLIRVLQRAAPV